MPLYEYRCRACGDTFEALRPVNEADAALACGCGEVDVARLPSLIARAGGGGTGEGALPMAGSPSAGGGCCGGGCCG